MNAKVLLNLLNKLRKRDKCEACRAFYLFFSMSLINRCQKALMWSKGLIV